MGFLRVTRRLGNCDGRRSGAIDENPYFGAVELATDFEALEPTRGLPSRVVQVLRPHFRSRNPWTTARMYPFSKYNQAIDSTAMASTLFAVASGPHSPTRVFTQAFASRNKPERHRGLRRARLWFWSGDYETKGRSCRRVEGGGSA